MFRFDLLRRFCVVGIAATVLAGCDIETPRPSGEKISRFRSDLGVGSYIFQVDQSYNGSQSIETHYWISRVVHMEGDYVLTRRVARVDAHDMTRQDYEDLKGGIGIENIRQWNIPIPDHLKEKDSIDAIHAYSAALTAMLKSDPTARYYIQCNSTVKNIYSKSGIATDGELKWYRSWWDVELDGKALPNIGTYIEELTKPVLANEDTCRDNGDWRARLHKPATSDSVTVQTGEGVAR